MCVSAPTMESHMPQAETANFIHEPPVIEITAGVVIIRYRDGERAMSVKTLARAVDRGNRALQRHAAGDQNIIVDD